MAITTGGCSGMAWPDAGPLGADPQAAAELPANDAGVDEYLYPAPQHPGFVRLWAGRTAAADPTAEGSTAAAVLPADGPGDDEHLHADVQPPPLLRPRGDAPCSGRHPRNCTRREKRRSKEDQ